MRSFIFALFLLSGCTFAVFAQKGPLLKFSANYFDFGKINEKEGPVSCALEFSNIGTDTLVFQKIKTSVPNLTAEPTTIKVAPKDKGMLKITFSPKGENGRVERFISIRTNDSESSIRQLSIVAIVTPMEKTMADFYPQPYGNLWFKTKHLAFDQFKNTETRTDTFKVYNAWKYSMSLEMKDVPAYTTWKIIPRQLAPQKEGLIIVTYDADKSSIWGLNYETFRLSTTDSLDPEKVISIGVNIIEDFSVQNKEILENPPHIVFKETQHDFGSASEGQTLEHSYVFTNTGKSKLIIRRVKPGCGCTIAEIEKKEIEPGKEGKITISFITTGYTGKQAKSIMVITNDPKEPMVLLSFSADVNKK